MCYELCGPPINGTPEDMANYDAWLCSLDPQEDAVEDAMIASYEEDEVKEEDSNTIGEHAALERFDDFLNEIHETVTICGYNYDPAQALKMCDEIAYREEFNNWLDSEGLELE